MPRYNQKSNIPVHCLSLKSYVISLKHIYFDYVEAKFCLREYVTRCAIAWLYHCSKCT